MCWYAVLYIFSKQNSETFDTSHTLFSLTVTKLSTLKNSCFLAHPVYATDGRTDGMEQWRPYRRNVYDRIVGYCWSPGAMVDGTQSERNKGPRGRTRWMPMYQHTMATFNKHVYGIVTTWPWTSYVQLSTGHVDWKYGNKFSVERLWTFKH